jgi:hypothetical protein
MISANLLAVLQIVLDLECPALCLAQPTFICVALIALICWKGQTNLSEFWWEAMSVDCSALIPLAAGLIAVTCPQPAEVRETFPSNGCDLSFRGSSCEVFTEAYQSCSAAKDILAHAWQSTRFAWE